MFDTTQLSFLIVLVITLIGECSSIQGCFGTFYKTELSYYYGRYYVSRNYYQQYKVCDDMCCTLSSNGYKYCCSNSGVVPSYTSSSKPSSSTGIIVGCTIGGTLFAVVVIFSLLVFRCMWRERKRIEPASIVESGSSKTEEAIVSKVDTPVIEDGSAIIPPSAKSTPVPHYTVKQ
ncbi:uncharacterized protein LOC110451780 [Mizuhopecten yessoensis]|uniref:uncharacterized protein LOC110451780 n=1 Tax=Mizuhopecten yessoensis TaxID=6573 RepID=UPI000B458A4B|nr:uncharacterized protein LOC110451780 [Mizuhopecten yessoensis]